VALSTDATNQGRDYNHVLLKEYQFLWRIIAIIACDGRRGGVLDIYSSLSLLY
jgi:hypothetical protein